MENESNEGLGVPQSPEQAQTPRESPTPEQIRLQQERQKTLDYVNKRLNLTDAEGQPLSPEVADLVIKSAQLEVMDTMAEMLKANLENGTPFDPVKFERAYLLSAKAYDLQREQARDTHPFKAALTKNLFSGQKEDRLKGILRSMTTGSTEDMSAMQQKVMDEIKTWTEPKPEAEKVNRLAEYDSLKTQGNQTASTETPKE